MDLAKSREVPSSSGKMPKAWSVKDDLLAAMKRSTNKYYALRIINNESLQEDETVRKFKEVDKFLFLRKQPTKLEKKNWDKDKMQYFDKHKNLQTRKEFKEGECSDDEEEVEEIISSNVEFVIANEYGTQSMKEVNIRSKSPKYHPK